MGRHLLNIRAFVDVYLTLVQSVVTGGHTRGTGNGEDKS